MAAPNFTTRAWLAFDPPSSTAPTWVEITGYVQQESPININHGRGDNMSDVSVSTCSLTVDNTSGNFLAANKAGAWYGQIGKGNWLKVEITPPSNTVSQRFVGFITGLPDEFEGDLQYGLITASDRFEKLGGAPALISTIQHEVVSDPNLVGSGSIQGYWGLHEAQGSLTFGDTSGQGARYLQATGAGGVPAGIGFGASNVAGPGFDGQRAVTFNPVSANVGTYLTGPITSPMNGTWNTTTGAYGGLYGTLEFWFQFPVSTAGTPQVLAAVVDPATNFGYTVAVLNHRLSINPWGTNYNNQAGGYTIVFSSAYPFTPDDGQWHHLIVGVAATNSGGGWASTVAIVDGVWCYANTINGGSVGTTSGNFTQLMIGGGYYTAAAPGVVYIGEVNICEVAWYWSDLWNQTPANGRPPDALTHYKAGATGFAGESTDFRIARIARYMGFPKPATTLSYDSFNPVGLFTPSTLGQVQTYSPVKTAWLNLSPGAHTVSTQSITGRKPLDVMQEVAHTENMPLYMDRSGYLAMQPSTTRQNAAAAWTIAAPDLDPSTRVADDFAYTTNQMTITPNAVASQTVIGGTGSAGRLSQAKYDIKDGSQSTASVNPIEAQSLGLGIIQLRADPPPRLAPLAFEVSTTALLPGYGSAWFDAVLATEISTAVAVSSAPAAVGGGTYTCLVEGWSETITAGSLMLAFNVSAVQGPTYQLDDVVLGHIDTDGSTLAVSITGTDASFQVATTNAGSPLWTTNTSDFPFDINIGGEQITIKSITGATSPQFFNVSVRAVNGTPLSLNGADGTFETGTAGWSPTSGTFAASTAQAHSGTQSGLLTVTGTPTQTYVRTPQIPVTPGTSIAATQWVLTASGSPSCKAVIDFYDASHNYVSTYASSAIAAPGVWTVQQSLATVPAGIAYAAIGPTISSSPPAGTAIYVDDVTLMSPASHSSGAQVSLWQPLTLAY